MQGQRPDVLQEAHRYLYQRDRDKLSFSLSDFMTPKRKVYLLLLSNTVAIRDVAISDLLSSRPRSSLSHSLSRLLCVCISPLLLPRQQSRCANDSTSSTCLNLCLFL
jgi:hypothetical protein